MRRAFPGPGAATAAIVSACALLAPWRCSPAWAAPAAKAVAAAEAGRHIGEEATVCGPVAGGTYADRSNGKPTFLDFQRSYPDEVFRVVIWGNDRAKFKQPPDRLFAGRQVCAAGRIQLYRGQPEIVVSDPSHL